MEIPGISANDPFSFSQSDQASELDRGSFLQLLVTQMRNQDPLDPASNEQMIAQLAEFSALEEMQNLNENIVGLAVLQQNNALMSQLTNSSSLIGMTVTYVDPTSGESATGTVSSVKIEEGLAVLSIDGKDIPLANVTEVTGQGSQGN